jgi:hypothetical protein
MADDYTINLHKQFNFPLGILREYIYKHTNIKVCGFKKITDGIECEVYDIGEYMVKIRRKGEVPFDCIKWVVDKCKENNIRVPDIIHCGKISDTNSDFDIVFDIIIEEKVQGECITPDLYEEAGAELKKLHNIKVNGFWKMYEAGKFYIDITDINGKKDDDDDNYNTSLRDIVKYFRDERIYDSADTNYIEKLLHQHKNLEISPVLCHGDYHPRHILGDKQLNGIIDFGDFQGGSGYIDLVNFQMYSEEGHFDKFLKGYGEIDEKIFMQEKVHTLVWEIIESEDEDRKKYEQILLNTIKIKMKNK